MWSKEEKRIRSKVEGGRKDFFFPPEMVVAEAQSPAIAWRRSSSSADLGRAEAEPVVGLAEHRAGRAGKW